MSAAASRVARATARWCVPALVVAAAFGVGIWLGRRIALAPFKRALADFAQVETLGGAIANDGRAHVAQAYDDPEAAARQLDGYAWSGPDVPTPFVGSAPAPGLHANAFINSMQLRADHELIVPKPEGVVRVFVTGGSGAFGSGAPSQQRTIGGFLQAILDREETPRTGLRYEVLTFADPGWSSTHERIAIENRVSELEPDLVVSYTGNNDVHWGSHGRDVLWFQTYTDELFARLIRDARASAGVALLEAEAPRESFVDPTLVAARFDKNVRLAAAALELAHARLLVVLQPTLSVSHKARSARERAIGDGQLAEVSAYFVRCYEALRARMGAASIPGVTWSDRSSVFDALGAGDEIFIDDYHFADRGSELVARAIAGDVRAALANR